ncbi:hypothetical protein EW145_g7009 [Phellinidium pouzarii]|uniref:NAD(P)-binding protein n=1 Tax=Phellinidium pouzarii TaxID=167371 RepID=A0A4S4KR55_9AGAM|nr:hypothetical protein EW145_g7009 [Phellinidium pouzarii]
MPGIAVSKCVLVVGATAGIGRALALAIWALPSKPTVIVAGRRKERLEELVKKGLDDGDGRIKALQVDLTAARDSLKAFTEHTLREYPDVRKACLIFVFVRSHTYMHSQLDSVVFSAGIQHITDFSKPEEIDLDGKQPPPDSLLFFFPYNVSSSYPDFTSEVNINYIAIVTLITFFLPHFLKLSTEGRPTFIIPISSMLAIVPSGTLSDYCAMKAALHSLSLSLHSNLASTNVHIMEILPPLVESELHDNQGTSEALSKIWMPLDTYTKYAMEGLLRGDVNIVTPNHEWLWEKFEKDKIGETPMSLHRKHSSYSSV